jgi:uncharacterized damage-inducible protein DinB
MPIQTVRDLWRYDQRVFDRFERSAERRGWRAAIADRGTGHLSIKDTLVHILNVREVWLVAIAQDRWEVTDDPGRYGPAIRSWSSLRAYRDRIDRAVEPWLARLREPMLAKRVRAPWMPGRYTVEDAFFQASIEQAHHLGEIIGVYWQQDWSPPPMTWIENVRRTGRR